MTESGILFFSKKIRNGGFVILAAFFCYFVFLQIAWLHLDNRPIWEKRHFFTAAKLANVLGDTEAGREYQHNRHEPYPPLVTTFTAPLLALTKCNSDVAIISLLPFAFLLLWTVWRLCRIYFSDYAAVTGAMCALCFQHFAVIELQSPPYSFLKGYLLDLPLAAMVALTLFMLITLIRQNSRKNQILLGVIMGLGALTKINYAIYFLIIIGTVLFSITDIKTLWKRLRIPCITALIIAGPWYILNSKYLAADLFYREFNAEYALTCGMPPVFSISGFLFYLFELPKMISPPFTILLTGALFYVMMRRTNAWKLVTAGVFLSYFVLTLFLGKGPRVIGPCMIFGCIAIAAAVDTLHSAKLKATILYTILIASMLHISFMNGFGPGLGHNAGIPFQMLAPVFENWKIDQIMQDIDKYRDPSLLKRVSVVPRTETFNHNAFTAHALENGTRLFAESEWLLRTLNWKDELNQTEFIITKTGDNGLSRYIPNRKLIDEWIDARIGSSLHLKETYSLPDGSIAKLYKHDRTFPTWKILQNPSTNNPVAVFGKNIALNNYSIDREEDRLILTCEWTCIEPLHKEYKLFVYVLQGIKHIANKSFVPGTKLKPTTGWDKDFCIQEEYTVPLPSDFKDEKCEIWLGWFRGFNRMPVRRTDLPDCLNAVCVKKF